MGRTIQHVLWAYRTTPHFAIGETSFRMVYGKEVVIHVEIGEPNFKVMNLNLEENEGAIRAKLDLVEERINVAVIKEEALKRKIVVIYNKKVISKDLVKTT